MIHTALIRPSWMRSNISTAFGPWRVAMVGLPQKPCTAARPGASSRSMCAANVFAKPPTSRPPMALGWPVTENGPAPGLPILPVARWQLMMALTLSVPAELWFTPWENAVITAGVCANSS